jgi:beta-mannosidase
MRGTRQHTLDLAGPLEAFGREKVYLRIALDVGGRCVSQDTVLCTLPRFIDLPPPRTRVELKARGARRATVTFTSPVFQHRFAFDFAGRPATVSDNFFDLYPGEPRRVAVEFATPASAAAWRRALTFRSLADTY